MPRPLRVLIAEDNPADAELVVFELRHAGFDPEWHRVDTEAEYVERLSPDLDLILSDFQMPQFGGLRALELLKGSGLEIPFIIISGTIGEDLAVNVMKKGATDYLLKDRLGRLGQAVMDALEKKRLRGERRQMEQQLLLQSTALESAGNAVIVTDRSGIILWVNPAFTALTGYGAEEILGKTPRILKSGKHDRAFYRELWKTILSGQTWHGEFTNRRKDGSLFYDAHTIAPVLSAGGEITHFIGVMQDVTEHRRTEESLKLFRNLVDQSEDTIEVVDPETGRFLDVNESGCFELGYSREEFLSLHVWDVDTLVSEQDWPQVVERMRAAGFLRREGPHRRRKDGTTYPIELNAKWVRLDREYIVAVVRDITARKEAEQHSREREALLANAQRFGRMGTWNFDVRSNLLIWSEETCHLFGLTPAEFDGTFEHFYSCVLAEDQAVCEAAQRRVSFANPTLEVEYRIRRPDGEVRWMFERGNIEYDAAGNQIRRLGMVMDITERKKLEEQFLRAQRMESIGTLAGGIAHDLNNVLSPILMSLSLLEMKFDDPESKELIEMIRVSAQRGTDMVRQVLSFARGYEGRRMEVQLRHLVREIEKMANETFLKTIEIRTLFPHDLWTVTGDPTQLHQVLLNLCVNARDAMPDGGLLVLSAENLTLDAPHVSLHPEAKPGPYVLLKVEDSGTGIAPEIVEKIFDPFFTTKEIGKGTGLGLSTSLAIVKSHGGFLQVYSEPGKGTAFKIYFPARAGESAVSAVEAAAELPHGSGELILIVDDEAIVRQITQQALEAFGYRVLLAADGKEAVTAYLNRRAEIAAVITDMMMPVMDGPTTIAVLQKINPAVRIIATSGLTVSGQAEQAARLGAKHFLPKPYTAETLLKALKEILAGQK